MELDNGCLTIMKLPDEQALRIVEGLLVLNNFEFTNAIKKARGLACVLWIYFKYDTTGKYEDLWERYIYRLSNECHFENIEDFEARYLNFYCSLLTDKYLDWKDFSWSHPWEWNEERYITLDELRKQVSAQRTQPKQEPKSENTSVEKKTKSKSHKDVLDEAKYYRNEILIFLYKEGKLRTRSQIESGIGLYTTDTSKKSAVKKRVLRFLNTLIDKNLVRKDTRVLSYNDSVVKYTLTEEGRKVVEYYLI